MSSFLKVKLDCVGWESKTQFEVNFNCYQEKINILAKYIRYRFFMSEMVLVGRWRDYGKE